ncbi:helix-turn-helix domain-containing protein [Fibrella aquatilis]|uniref:Helix-turn-helix transcriptional regulator n=1 Tax=Fibrella aquatilis TaxID=2817059 RepID=A0A939G508_9BACT|nr:helix-turn-helix transcriptional regulator [Fibrella aquatilis]MBO0932011.1 helix-turn-helix transcriptional regulator [Fibrella aquatilis]
MNIGEKIRFLRKTQGLSQTVLALKAQVSLPYLNQIEKGKADSVSDDILKQIGSVLDTSLAELKSTDTGLKIGFSPTVWSIPLLSMLINKPSIPIKFAYSHEINHSQETSRRLNFVDLESDEQGAIVSVTGKELFEEGNEPEASFELVTHKDLQFGINSQLFDLVFIPSITTRAQGTIPIATICDTIKGGLYAIVFANNPRDKGWVVEPGQDLESRRKLAKSDFLHYHRLEKEQWFDFVKNSIFYYQKDSISEFIINDVIAKYKLEGNQRVEIKSDKVEDNVFIMSNIMKTISGSNQGSASNVTQYISRIGEAFAMLTLPSAIILKQVVKAFNEKFTGNTYTVYIGWEPFISKIKQQYEQDHANTFCLLFNVNRFLYSDDSLIQLNYECLIKNDKLDIFKKNADIRLFFTELDKSVQRVNQLAHSESISPEINAISDLLEMPADKIQALIRKVNFSLKFYPDWVL